MERYKRCHVYVDAEHVKRLAQYHYGSIKEFLKDLGYSRQRYYKIVKNPHRSADEECIKKIAKCLGTQVQYITYEIIKR